MRRLSYLLMLLCVTVTVGACGIVQPSALGATADERANDGAAALPSYAALSAVVEAAASRSIKLGYHYRPPSDGTDVSALVDEVSFIILSKNDEAYRDQVRAAGYDGLILQYVMANEVDGPAPIEAGDACDESFKPWQNQVANQVGDFCKYIHPNEDWFLHNGQSERLYGMNEDRYFYRMNPASEGWRQFAIERLKQRIFRNNTIPPLGYDGLFFDNVELSMQKTLYQLENSNGKVKEYRSDRDFRKAWRSWLQYMRNRLGSKTPLWANLIAPRRIATEWNDYLPYLDGVMNEAFVTGYNRSLDSTQQTNELLQAEYALSQDKGFYAVSQGKEKDTGRQTFALASYLLIVRPGAPNYFRYTRSDSYTRRWHYDNYNVRLGAPLGPRYEIKNGWRRDFSNGYVTVDQKARKGTIVQRER